MARQTILWALGLSGTAAFAPEEWQGDGEHDGERADDDAEDDGAVEVAVAVFDVGAAQRARFAVARGGEGERIVLFRPEAAACFPEGDGEVALLQGFAVVPVFAEGAGDGGFEVVIARHAAPGLAAMFAFAVVAVGGRGADAVCGDVKTVRVFVVQPRFFAVRRQVVAEVGVFNGLRRLAGGEGEE